MFKKLNLKKSFFNFFHNFHSEFLWKTKHKCYHQIALILSFNLVYSISLSMEKRLSNSRSRTTNLTRMTL